MLHIDFHTSPTRSHTRPPAHTLSSQPTGISLTELHKAPRQPDTTPRPPFRSQVLTGSQRQPKHTLLSRSFTCIACTCSHSSKCWAESATVTVTIHKGTSTSIVGKVGVQLLIRVDNAALFCGSLRHDQQRHANPMASIYWPNHDLIDTTTGRRGAGGQTGAPAALPGTKVCNLGLHVKTSIKARSEASNQSSPHQHLSCRQMTGCLQSGLEPQQRGPQFPRGRGI